MSARVVGLSDNGGGGVGARWHWGLVALGLGGSGGDWAR